MNPYALGHFALVDTGADGTIVPEYIVEELGAESDNDKILRGYSGDRQIVKMYYLDIEVGTRRFPAVAVAADPRMNEIVIGRNLLNKLVLTLNGPKQELEIQE